jgi:hypothetical protein
MTLDLQKSKHSVRERVREVKQEAVCFWVFFFEEGKERIRDWKYRIEGQDMQHKPTDKP